MASLESNKILSNYNSNTGKISFKNKSENTFSWKQKLREFVAHISTLKETLKKKRKENFQSRRGKMPDKTDRGSEYE